MEQLRRDVVEVCVSVVVWPPQLSVWHMEREGRAGMPQRAFHCKGAVAAGPGDLQTIVADVAACDVAVVIAFQPCAIAIDVGGLEEYILDICLRTAFNVDMPPDSHADRTAHDVPAVHMGSLPGVQRVRGVGLCLREHRNVIFPCLDRGGGEADEELMGPFGQSV